MSSPTRVRLLSTEMSTLPSKAVAEGAAQISERYLDEPSGREHEEESLTVENVIHNTYAAGSTQRNVVYKVYKRRWFGLAQLTLLNIMYAK